VRPSSSTSEGLWAGLFARGPVALEVDDRAWLQALLDVEAALARAGARAGVVPPEAAEDIACRCRAEEFDLEELGEAATRTGNPVPALVRALGEQVGEEAAAHVHRGATSQDVIDTAMMLVARRALGPLLDDLAAAADACATLVEAHRDTLVAGRTLLQQALPLPFALKAAGWLSALDEARGVLLEARERAPAAQLGGAVGTLASLGVEGPAVAEAFAEEIGLAAPALPWHTNRLRVAVLAGALGAGAGVVGKVAGDVALLAQTEVGEAAEAEGGGSSTMPQKRNPVGAVLASACARRAPGLVATLLSSMDHEHERAAGAWHAEWEALSDLLRLTGAAAAWLRGALEGLQVDPERARANLEATGGLLMAERVAGALAPGLGRQTAHDLVAEAARRVQEEGVPFRDALLATEEVERTLGPEGVDAALDPADYLGAAGTFVDRALRAHRAAAPR
jgi:3-carboxy-cis,cis-muconate cycloisomerase